MAKKTKSVIPKKKGGVRGNTQTPVDVQEDPQINNDGSSIDFKDLKQLDDLNFLDIGLKIREYEQYRSQRNNDPEPSKDEKDYIVYLRELEASFEENDQENSTSDKDENEDIEADNDSDSKQSPVQSSDDEDDFIQSADEFETRRDRMRREARERISNQRDSARNSSPSHTYNNGITFKGEIVSDETVEKLKKMTTQEIDMCSNQDDKVLAIIVQLYDSKPDHLVHVYSEDIDTSKMNPREQGSNLNQKSYQHMNRIKAATFDVDKVNKFINSHGGESSCNKTDIQSIADIYNDGLSNLSASGEVPFSHLTALTLEGHCKNKGVESKELMNARAYVHSEEVNASLTNLTLQSFLTSSEKSSGSEILASPSKRVGDQCPASLKGSAYQDISSELVISDDEAYFRQQNASNISSLDRGRISLLAVEAAHRFEEAFTTSQVISATMLYEIHLYAAGQVALFKLIKQISAGMSSKSSAMKVAHQTLQEYESKPLSMINDSKTFQCVLPSPLTLWAYSQRLRVNHGAIALEIFQKAHNNSGKWTILQQYSQLVSSRMEISHGIKPAYETRKTHWKQVRDLWTIHVPSPGEDKNELSTSFQGLSKEFELVHLKSELEDILYHLDKSSNTSTFFRELYEKILLCSNLDEVDRLIDIEHSRNTMPPVQNIGSSTTMAAQVSANSQGNKRDISRISDSEWKSMSSEVKTWLDANAPEVTGSYTTEGNYYFPINNIDPVKYNTMPPTLKESIRLLRQKIRRANHPKPPPHQEREVGRNRKELEKAH